MKLFNSQDRAARERLLRWKADPLLFVLEAIRNPDGGRITPDDWQADALRAFPSQPKMCIPAAKGPGKTALEAWLAYNFLLTRPHARVPCTSISGENLRSNLWTELAKWRKSSPILDKEFEWTASKVFQRQHPDTWFAEARAWPKQADANQQAATLAGFHADFIFFVLDEAGGIPAAVAATAEAALSTGKETRMLLCGNKTHLSGPIYDACTKHRNLWFVIEVTGDPDDSRRSPRIDKGWAKEQIAKYGREHDWVRINVLNLFPRQQANVLVSLDDIEKAVRRQYTADQVAQYPKLLGVDVAQGGDDESTIVPRQGPVVFKIEHELGQPDTMQLVDHVAFIANKWGADAIFVDICGVGAGVHDRLRQVGFNVFGVNGADEAVSQDVRCFNKRTQVWWDMAQWLKTGSIPDDALLRSELPSPTYTIDDRGRIKLETKRDMKKRGVRSPNRADGLAYTFALPVQSRAQSHQADRVSATPGRCLSEFDPMADPTLGPPAHEQRPAQLQHHFNPFSDLGVG